MLNKAIMIAVEAHAGQIDKAGARLGIFNDTKSFLFNMREEALQTLMLR
ncbi:MAG: hypothetical protein K0R31_2130 [Clostridiales bacterium]|jgi:hypothetical protein|nr:hypothetical protein [Clostridiales bacterium]